MSDDDDDNKSQPCLNIDDDEDDESVKKPAAVCINSDDDNDDNDAMQKDCPPHFPTELTTIRGSRLLEHNRKVFDKDHRSKEYVVAIKVVLINEDGSIKFQQVLESLTSKQLRWFSRQCGCKDYGSLNKFNARVLIARTKNSKKNTTN